MGTEQKARKVTFNKQPLTFECRFYLESATVEDNSRFMDHLRKIGIVYRNAEKDPGSRNE